MEQSIHDILPNHVIEKIVMDHCDIKTILKFQATSMAGNVMYIKDIKERIADGITEKVFDQLLKNITDYHTLLTDEKKMFVLMKPVIQKFATILLEYCLRNAMQSSNRDYYKVMELINNIKARTELDNKSLMQVLWALDDDTALPDNLREKRDMCFEILKEYYCSINGWWFISFDDYNMNITMSKMLGTIRIKTSDIEKVTKHDTFKIYPSVFSSNVTNVQFHFAKETIPDIARLFQSLYGRYMFVRKDTINISLDLDSIFKTKDKFINDFNQTHFNRVIKI
jgi:hypothetical protein